MSQRLTKSGSSSSAKKRRGGARLMKAAESTFREYSGGGTTIKAEAAPDVARVLGFAPSQKEVEAFLQSLGGATCSFENFSRWLQVIKHPDSAEEMTRAFQPFDPGNTGLVSYKVLKNVLSNVGEPMSEAEIEDMWKNLCDSKDPVNYHRLIHRLLSTA